MQGISFGKLREKTIGGGTGTAAVRRSGSLPIDRLADLQQNRDRIHSTSGESCDDDEAGMAGKIDCSRLFR